MFNVTVFLDHSDRGSGLQQRSALGDRARHTAAVLPCAMQSTDQALSQQYDPLCASQLKWHVESGEIVLGLSQNS